jgi:branched-chain amino acid transport system ATP-binding protein
MNDDALLSVNNVSRRFGGILALSDYSLTLRVGELAGLIGPNGAGKTTAFNVLSGVLAPTNGTLSFDGQDITGYNACRCARVGIARTFQNIRLFQDLTVRDNILVGFHHHMGQGFWPTLLNLPRFRRVEAQMRRRAEDLAAMLGLAALLDQQAGALPYGDQRRLEIARALATGPKLLLLDEPAAGMNPQETHELAQTIRRIHKDFQLTIFLVEHDMHLVMDLCERLQVINYGRLLAEGDPSKVRANPEVVAAYLGSPDKKKRGKAC